MKYTTIIARYKEQIMNLSDEQMYEIVVRRDGGYDGQFYVGVHSTGIYCRPSCKSRTPLRKNVRFYATPDDAEAAGLRACKRCRPRELVYNPSEDLVREVCAYIEENAVDTRLTLEVLSERFSLSPFHLQRVFKQIVGVSPREYARSVRTATLKQELRQQTTVTNAIYAAGYQSNSRAYAAGDAAVGMTLSDYRNGGAQKTILYSVQPCELGWLLVAATERGLCSVKLGDNIEGMIEELKSEFYAADVMGDDEALSLYMGAIQDYLAGNQSLIQVPLDIQGTVFQHKVWDALRRIPYGERRTYSQIAADIQQPGAVRAVGSACGANPVALVIPCHRVVRAGGDLGGYHWGLERKRVLLAQEQRLAEAPVLGV
jgi:AraC family transcriptional regulator of adaptative response/methylated-DNA-[protein]-cysteine methyltransferase